MSRLSWPAAWAAAGAVAAALLAANIAAPPVFAGSAAGTSAVHAADTAPPPTSPTPGTEATPPTTPGDLRACPPPPPPSGSFQGVVGLCWTASADDTGVTGYEVLLLTPDGFVEAASTSRTTAVVTGLVHGRTYTFYVVARDAAGNVSRPTALLSTPAVSGGVTPTPGPGDTTPPTRPTGMQANCLPDFKGTSFCWTPSTDDVGVSGYDVYRRTDAGWTRVGSPLANSRHFTEGNLVTGQSYVYFIVAEDAAGNLSLPSDLVTTVASGGFPPYTPPPVSCALEYEKWTWGSGFSATVRITNIGRTPMNGWTLRFVLPDAGQKINSGWSASWSQSGKDVTAVNMPWNSVIGPGASVLVGFDGTHTGANPDATGFTVNRGRCVMW